jgi:hypothetical protein
MSQKQTTPIYCGSPATHPDQRHIGTWLGLLEDQDDDTINGFSMIRTGFKPSMTTLPNVLYLKLGNEMTVSGMMEPESLSLTSPEGSIRFYIPEWGYDILRFYFVEIKKNGEMIVHVRQNPPDPQRVSQRTHS